MVAFIQPSFVVSFSIFCVVGHSKFFHIYFSHGSVSQKVQYLLYTRQGAQNHVFIHTDRSSLWHAGIGIVSMNRTYIKKRKYLDLL